MSYDNLTENYKRTYLPLKSVKPEDIRVTSIQSQGHCLKVEGAIDYPGHETNDTVLRINLASLYLIAQKGCFRAYITVAHDTRYYFLPNYKDYVILTSDGRPIPKVMISAYPKDAYQKANSMNCYLKREGNYVEILGDGFEDTKTFCDIDKKEKYIDSDAVDEAMIRQLIVNVIRRYTRYI